MPRSLGFMIHGGLLEPEQMADVLRDISTASDRAAAIIAGSLLEMSLTTTLKVILHKNKKITDEVFNVTGAMGAFKTKIQLGFLVGLYGDQALKDLLIVKDIRNAFAHSLEISSFKSDRIKSWTDNLKFCERYVADELDIKTKAESKTNPGPNVPHKDWDFWVIVKDKAELLGDPRERYI